MEYAPRTNRLLGQILDGVITAIPLFVAAFSTMVNDTLGGLAVVTAILTSIGYYFLADALPGGQSIGKKVLHMSVVDERTGRACTPWQSFVRNLLLALLGPLDWVFIFGSRYQRLGDKVAGTIVLTTTDAAAREPF
jgi:uncharacterized RDD family membrane protein YckC